MSIGSENKENKMSILDQVANSKFIHYQSSSITEKLGEDRCIREIVISPYSHFRLKGYFPLFSDSESEEDLLEIIEA